MSSGSNISEFMTANQTEQTSFLKGKNAFWYTVVFLQILIIILATLGNLVVLVATWVERNLHQPNKYFIGCLAVADLLIGGLYCPFQLYEYLIGAGINSIHFCRFFTWINVFAESASIDTLTFISFDRYLRISKPLRYNLLMTTSKSIIVIAMIWLISIAYATFAMFSYEESRGIYIGHFGCVNENDVFFTFSAISAFFLPTIITLVMYTRILLIAHKRRKTARNGGLGQTNQLSTPRTSLYRDLKNIRIMAIVMGAFVFCWGPFFITMMLYIYNQRLLHSYLQSYYAPFIVSQILPILNSICNPIIYACLDEKYREAFKRLFKRMVCW